VDGQKSTRMRCDNSYGPKFEPVRVEKLLFHYRTVLGASELDLFSESFRHSNG